ncbi:hypothetical protein ACIQ57_24560 [Lysinibacillus xylanilyticus]|uniref:hypothetical protein n=1 Tax=Lysinibacillus xylanilyticus TaxID=582475 RepID=UPI00380F2938
MDEEIKPTETPTPEEMPVSDITNYMDEQIVEVVSDNQSLVGTVLQNVFGNQEIMVFIVSVMVLVTLLIISTDFMRWKGRD